MIVILFQPELLKYSIFAKNRRRSLLPTRLYERAASRQGAKNESSPCTVNGTLPPGKFGTRNDFNNDLPLPRRRRMLGRKFFFLLLKMVPQCQGERDSFRDVVGGDYVRRDKFRHRNVWFCGRRDEQIVCENEMHPLELGL